LQPQELKKQSGYSIGLLDAAKVAWYDEKNLKAQCRVVVCHPFSSRSEASVSLVSQVESHLSYGRRIPLPLCTLRRAVSAEASRGVMGSLSRDWGWRTRTCCGYSSVKSIDFMPQGVQLAQIERIFEILDRLGISREAVIIPLRPQGDGTVRRLSNGKLELIVPANTSFDEWYASLEGAIKDVYPT